MHDLSAYNHPGIAVVASTGDGGFDTGGYPASDDHVVAVGGTSVTRDGSTRGYHETAWTGAGSGCGVNPKPAWQSRPTPLHHEGRRRTCPRPLTRASVG